MCKTGGQRRSSRAFDPYGDQRAAVAASGGLPARTEVTVNLAAVNPMAGVGTTLQMVYGIFTGPVPGCPVSIPLRSTTMLAYRAQ